MKVEPERRTVDHLVDIEPIKNWLSGMEGTILDAWVSHGDAIEIELEGGGSVSTEASRWWLEDPREHVTVLTNARGDDSWSAASDLVRWVKQAGEVAGVWVAPDLDLLVRFNDGWQLRVEGKTPSKSHFRGPYWEIATEDGRIIEAGPGWQWTTFDSRARPSDLPWHTEATHGVRFQGLNSIDRAEHEQSLRHRVAWLAVALVVIAALGGIGLVLDDQVFVAVSTALLSVSALMAALLAFRR